MTSLVIYVGQTHFKFAMKKNAYLHTGENIRHIVNEFFSYEFDARNHTYTLKDKYVYYDEKKEMIHFPRGAYDYVLKQLQEMGISTDSTMVVPNKAKPVKIRVKPSWKPTDLQWPAIKSLCNDKVPMRGIALQTGKGKTFCMNYAISQIGLRTIIYVGGLMDQWQKALIEQTDLTEKDIYMVSGAYSISKLLRGIDRTIHPKVIIASISTMRSYFNGGDTYEKYPPFDEFHEKCKIGVRCVDEAHLNFLANLMVDLRSNVEHTLIATATFDRTDHVGKRVFDMTYPQVMRFGADTYHRYVDIFDYGYRFATDVKEWTFKTPQGYNHPKFEDWLLSSKSRFFHVFKNVWLPIIQSHYLHQKKDGQKCLILVSTHNMCDALVEAMELYADGLTVVKFIGGVSDEVLSTYDIIISTPTSAGTGKDIKQLKFVLNTVSIASAPLNLQILGRLRVLVDDTPVFATVCDTCIRQHVSHREVRKMLFESRGKSFRAMNI